MGYLIPKPSNGTIEPIVGGDKEAHTLAKGISLLVNI